MNAVVPPSNLGPGQNEAMNDAALPPPKRVHAVKAGVDGLEAMAHESQRATDRSSGPPGPLHIDYTTTRVLPDALARLQRTHGVVRGDRSELAETFKMLRSQLLQRLRADGQSVLAVTSPRAMAGKSLTAVNLALTLAAEIDSTVLLVDADLSGQGLQALFGLEGQPGLSDHLSRGTAIPELLLNPGVPRLVLLPAGAGSTLQSAELLGTRSAHSLMHELKHRYRDRFLIVDLPPLLDTADALAFLPLADTTLLVVEEHRTAITDIEAANELLAPFNLVGAVMTQASQRPQPPPSRRLSRWFGRSA